MSWDKSWSGNVAMTENDSRKLNACIQLATQVHKEQRDKAGLPYILHPLHVLTETERRTRRLSGCDRVAVLCAAVLHDVIEDCPREVCPRHDLETHIAEYTHSMAFLGIKALTREPGEDWDAYIARVCGDWIGSVVKLIDLDHNSDLTRLPRVETADEERVARYARAKATILKAGKVPGLVWI